MTLESGVIFDIKLELELKGLAENGAIVGIAARARISTHGLPPPECATCSSLGVGGQSKLRLPPFGSRGQSQFRVAESIKLHGSAWSLRGVTGLATLCLFRAQLCCPATILKAPVDRRAGNVGAQVSGFDAEGQMSGEFSVGLANQVEGG